MRKIIRRRHRLPLPRLMAIFLVIGLLVIGLSLSPPATSGYVWCVTSDGHSALEAAIAGDCAAGRHAEATVSIAHTSVAIDDDGCGPCLDVSTSHHWMNGRPRQDKLTVQFLVPIAPAAVVAATPVPEEKLKTHRIFDRSPGIPEPSLHQRTVVLLI